MNPTWIYFCVAMMILQRFSGEHVLDIYQVIRDLLTDRRDEENTISGNESVKDDSIMFKVKKSQLFKPSKMKI